MIDHGQRKTPMFDEDGGLNTNGCGVSDKGRECASALTWIVIFCAAYAAIAAVYAAILWLASWSS